MQISIKNAFFTIAAIPVFLTGVISLDYLSASTHSDKIQQSLEKAAGVAARSSNLSNSQRSKLAKEVFAQEMRGDPDIKALSSPIFVISESGLTMSVKTNVQLRAFRFIHPSGISFLSKATVAISENK